MLHSLVLRLRRSLTRRGWSGTMRHCFNAAGHCIGELRPGKGQGRRQRWQAEVDFDRKHHVDTRGVIDLCRLDIESANWLYGTSCQGISLGAFHELMTAARIRCQDFVFVDLGSGKGRAILLASEYPFRKIIGVEFSRELVRVARQNIQNYQSTTQRCHNIEVVHADAAEYPIPDEALVLFLYNPFEAPIIDKVVANVRQSWINHPRPIVILYDTPHFAASWTTDEVFQPLKITPSYAIFETLPCQLPPSAETTTSVLPVPVSSPIFKTTK